MSILPFVCSNGAVHFADPEWFSFFCAVGLLDGIRDGRLQAVARLPYVNSVHQFLKALVVEFRCRQQVVPVLAEWLKNRDGATANRPIARNFAAYVLGMIGATEAQEDLACAAAQDRGQDVRLYAVAALGKLRARQQLPALRSLFASEVDSQVRLMIAQAVCRITGVAEFEM